jgi:hypothetical protein
VTHVSRKRRFGAVASLAAAYALVLNVILSSLLLASVSPADAAAGYQICHNNPDIAAAQDDVGKTTGQAPAHCPLCVGNHAPGAPPALNVVFASRIATAIATAVAPDETVTAHVITSDHRARAPPRLS